jgi:hypothetical protein
MRKAALEISSELRSFWIRDESMVVRPLILIPFMDAIIVDVIPGRTLANSYVTSQMMLLYQLVPGSQQPIDFDDFQRIWITRKLRHCSLDDVRYQPHILE